MEVGLRLRVGNNGRFFTWAVCSLPRRRVWHTRRRRVTCDAVSDLTPRLRDMQAAHYLKSLTEVPVRDASNAAAPHLCHLERPGGLRAEQANDARGRSVERLPHRDAAPCGSVARARAQDHQPWLSSENATAHYVIYLRVRSHFAHRFAIAHLLLALVCAFTIDDHGPYPRMLRHLHRSS